MVSSQWVGLIQLTKKKNTSLVRRQHAQMWLHRPLFRLRTVVLASIVMEAKWKCPTMHGSPGRFRKLKFQSRKLHAILLQMANKFCFYFLDEIWVQRTSF